MSDKPIEYQLKELELKQSELEIKRKMNEANYEYAKQTLKYQSDDMKEVRKKEIIRDKLGVMVVTMSIFLFFSFLFTAMMMNKDDLLSDIVKVMGLLFGGGITGYGLGARSRKEKSIKP